LKRKWAGKNIKEVCVFKNVKYLVWIFRKWDVGVRSGLGWLRIETGGEQL
jgi:hypothetical protein